MKEIQDKVKRFCDKNCLDAPPEYKVLDAMSELGEVAKEILKSSNYGKTKPKPDDGLKIELGDLLYSLITIANHYDISLDEALNLAMEKYEKRLLAGTIASKN